MYVCYDKKFLLNLASLLVLLQFLLQFYKFFQHWPGTDKLVFHDMFSLA